MDGLAWFGPLVDPLLTDMVSTQNNSRHLLLELYTLSAKKIVDMAFDFHLLLPHDNEDLALRAKALGGWCEEFIIGLSFAGVDVADLPSTGAQDVFIRFTEISKIDYENVNMTEEDECAFVDLQEYICMAVFMIYSEFAIVQSEAKRKKVVH